MGIINAVRSTNKKLTDLLINTKIRRLMAVFPHKDDASFVAGGFLQKAKGLGIKTKVISMLGNKDFGEFEKSCEILKVDEAESYNLSETNLKESLTLGIKKLGSAIKDFKPDLILTFDPHGITGHPAHISTSLEILKLLKTEKIMLLWRVADNGERKYFDKGHTVHITVDPTHEYKLNIRESFGKLKSIYAFKSKMTFLFKLQVSEWYLMDHKELYHLVDFSKNTYNLRYI